MCTVCKTLRVSRNHNTTKRHRTNLYPVVRASKAERRRYVARDYAAEGRRAAHEEEFGTPEYLDIIDPGTDTNVEF